MIYVYIRVRIRFRLLNLNGKIFGGALTQLHQGRNREERLPARVSSVSIADNIFQQPERNGGKHKEGKLSESHRMAATILGQNKTKKKIFRR